MLYKRAKTTHANSNNQLIAGDRCLGNSIASITGFRVTLVVAAAAKPSITRLQIRHQLIVMRRCRRRSLRSSNGNVFRRASRVRPPVGRSLAARPSARPAPASNCTGRHARESRDNFDESAAQRRRGPRGATADDDQPTRPACGPSLLLYNRLYSSRQSASLSQSQLSQLNIPA